MATVSSPHRRALQRHAVVVDLGEVEDVAQDCQQRVAAVQDRLRELPARSISPKWGPRYATGPLPMVAATLHETITLATCTEQQRRHRKELGRSRYGIRRGAEARWSAPSQAHAHAAALTNRFEVARLCSGLRLVPSSSWATAIMPLSGVRISWLMLARNMDLASVAVSAATLASCKLR